MHFWVAAGWLRLLLLPAALACQVEDLPEVNLLQLSLSGLAAAAASRPIVFQHIPFNFGHTIEKVAFAGTQNGLAYEAGNILAETGEASMRRLLESQKQDGGELWGRMVPELHQISNITGCALYFTPGKYWPRDMAQAYFQNKRIFGMLRDPYERLVAFFRGNIDGYGGSYPEFFKTCDVNGAVKKMLAKYLSGDKYAEDCTFIPQAEYFDPPFGITLPVDNRLFPDSANKVFEDYSYPENIRIQTADIMHVDGCNDVWAGDLDCETKALVRQVYARDFELLCKHFGYCDHDENCCIAKVPTMCPSNLTAKRQTATYCAQ